MKKTLLTLIGGVALALQCFAQNPIWIAAPKYLKSNGIAYNLPLGPVSSTGSYAGASAQCSSNAIADDYGNLRLFIVDGQVFDNQGYLLGIFNLNGFQFQGRSDFAIVPDPGSCDRLYIFGLSRNYSNGNAPDDIGYCVVDFTQYSSATPTRLGEVSPPVVFPGTPASSKEGNAFFAVSKKRSDNSHLIFASTHNSIRRFKLTSSGITLLSPAITFTGHNQTLIRAEMELYESSNPVADGFNYRIAVPFTPNPITTSVYTADLDVNGAVITGTEVINNYPLVSGTVGPFIHGLEFDKTGRYLFVSHTTNTTYVDALDYIDFNGTPFLQPVLLSGTGNFQHSQIEFGKINGQEGLYMLDGTNLGRLSIVYNTFPVADVFSLNTSVMSLPIAPSYMGTDALGWANYMDYKTYLLPDQIDGMDYNNFDYTYYDKITFSASANATWTGTSNPLNSGTAAYAYIKENLTIPKGRNITISGMEIHFAPGARLIIERGDGTLQGGKLTLTNGSKLTSDDRCSNGMWHGVEVQGNATVAQGNITTSQQGRLVLTGSSSVPVIIENALYGAAARSTNVSTGAVIAGYYGGIIQGKFASFIDNQNDVMLANYSFANSISYFTDCDFRTTGLLHNPALALGNHVSLTGVQGVGIFGCDFSNDNMSVFASGSQGAGIYSLNSNFTAEAYCTLPSPLTCFSPDKPCTFSNMTFGIVSISFGALTFKSDGNIFDNNSVGIGVSGTKNVSLVRNKFYVREVLSPVQSAGISLTGSAGYQVEENEFTERDNPLVTNTTGNSYGIVINNSGELYNQVYRNKFSNLKIGGQAELTNGTLFTGINGNGLVWKCNQFIHPIYSSDLALQNGRINYHQGYLTSGSVLTGRLAAANNKFSRDNELMALTHDFFVDAASPASNIHYVGYSSASPFYDLDSYTITKIAMSNATSTSGPITYAAEGCPTNFTDYGAVFLMQGGEVADEQSAMESKSLIPAADVVYEDEAYEAYLADALRQRSIMEIVHDSKLENKNEKLMAYLSDKVDRASQEMLAEIQISNGLPISETDLKRQNSSAEFIELLKIKKEMIHSEDQLAILRNGNIQASLKRISENKNDVLSSHQAKILLSLLEPVDLSYHFLEGTSVSDETSENAGSLSEKLISVYPNPAKDQLNISIKLKEDERVKAIVYSVSGSEIANWDVNSNKKNFDINQFENGIYLIKLVDQNGSVVETLRFVKQ